MSNCSNNEGGGGHLVLLPYMAHGHLIPFLSLARKLQQRTRFTVTIASTPLNLQYLRSAGAGDSTEIRLAELPFRSADHGLPPDTENTEKVPHGQMMRFLQAIQSLKPPLERLVEEITETEGRPPSLVFDVLLGWVMEVGDKFGIKSIAFTTGGAYGSLAYNSMWLNLPHRSTESDEFEVPGFPKSIRFHRTQLHPFIRNVDSKDAWCKLYQPQTRAPLSAHAWLVNTAEELEPLGLQLLRSYLKLPVWSVGPLLHGKSPSSLDKSTAEWLSQYGPDSVLYIAFGSQNSVSVSQMMALAMGLEASGKPFVWVIRPPVGFDIKGDFRSEWLPQGFEQRMNQTKQGLLIRTWAPQLEILSHKSVGAFLSHGGWNSVMESLSQGVPIIGWPMAAEQSYNVKLLVEEMGVCFELTRWADTDIDWKEIKRVVEMVMDNNSRGRKGEEMKMKAIHFGEKIRASVRDDDSNPGSSIVAMDELESFILSK